MAGRLAEAIAAGAPGGSVRFGVGTIVEWDRLTARNKIEWRGTTLTDVPIIASNAEVRLMQAGDPVALNIITGDGESSTVYIVGRIVLPGTPAAASALSVIADNIHSATVAASETRAVTSYADLTTVGPTVSNVLIGPSGRALVLATAGLFSNSGVADASGGRMSFEVSGATSVGPSDPDALRLDHVDFALNTAVGVRMTALAPVDDLNPGLHTFTAKYRSNVSGVAVSFGDRNLTVIAF